MFKKVTKAEADYLAQYRAVKKQAREFANFTRTKDFANSRLKVRTGRRFSADGSENPVLEKRRKFAKKRMIS